MAGSSNPYNGAPADSAEAAPMFCANHPNVPTYLRCGRCEKPICARCRVATPVGYRCYECANLAALPTYAVSTPYYTRAILAGFGLATLIGLLWAVLPAFDFWADLALGIGVSEAVSQAANLKRGPGLQVVGLLAVAWGLLAGRAALSWILINPDIARFVVQIPGNVESTLLQSLFSDRTNINFDIPSLFLHTDLVGWLFIAMAFILAYIRLR